MINRHSLKSVPTDDKSLIKYSAIWLLLDSTNSCNIQIHRQGQIIALIYQLAIKIIAVKESTRMISSKKSYLESQTTMSKRMKLSKRINSQSINKRDSKLHKKLSSIYKTRKLI